jgi:hypothetical protein
MPVCSPSLPPLLPQFPLIPPTETSQILQWKWEEVSGFDSLQLAELANCKDFTSHPYVQQFLNKVLIKNFKKVIFSYIAY